MRVKPISFFSNFLKSNKKFFFYIFLIALLYGIIFTLPDFINNPFDSFSDLLMITLQWGVVTFATFGMLYLLSANKYIFGVLFPVLTLFCSILTYFRWTANVTFTSMILDAALDNDIRITMELISGSLILFVTSCFAASVLLAWYRFRKITNSFFLIHFVIAGAILVGVTSFSLKIRRAISERVPFSIFFATAEYFSEKQVIAEKRKDISQGAVPKQDSVTVVFILGESLRADHLSINGYKRNTTPNLIKEKVVSFPFIYSEYTHTNLSVPHILTRADSVYKNRAYNEPSFISIFKKCGYYTWWLANQETADTYVYFLKEANELHYANMHKTVFNYDKWLDGDLLPYLDKSLQKKFSKKLIVLHTIGSHWWYNAHYPESFRKFQPVVKSKIISSCTREEVINSYDNTILYSDYFFKQVMDRLKSENAVLIYLSDHGEALGENNEWLHAHSNPVLNQAACFIWMSPMYQKKFPEKYAAIMNNKTKKYRTDFLFHSILSAGEIESPYYVKELDIFSKEN